MPKVMVRIVVELMVIAFFLLLGWSGYAVLDVLATDHLVSLPSIPVSWAQSVIPVSAALIVVAELLNLPRVVADARHETEVTGGASH
jgi:TRAP-type C4-dicarboxylate transport system permease small subunit